MGSFLSFGLDEWLDHIQRQHWRTIDLKLDRVSRVWQRLGGSRPPFVITVAGTNGKGSCVAMLESVLRRAGNRTGSYTSPHLVRYNERICIDGRPVSDAEIVDAFRRIQSACGDVGLTYFEYGTLCALLVFRARCVDVAILETGMGGRLDAVNMIDNDLALITSVGLDHMQWLGSDREQIGREKAGVIRPGAFVVSTDPAPPAAIADTAADLGAMLLQAGEQYSIEPGPDGKNCRWRSEHPAVPEDWRRLADLPLPLPGDWQPHNLGGTVAALALTSGATGVEPGHLVPGLSSARLPGRCEIVGREPLTIIDVAHNADSAAGLARFLDANPVPGETHGVFGVLADKALPGVLDDLGMRVNRWHLAGIDEARGQSGEALARKMRLLYPDMEAETYRDAVRAFQGARAHARPVDRVVAFGSFHVVGDIIGSFERTSVPQ